MQKRAPTLANILVIVLFALSCFGLLLFLWEAFGGPVPLKPKGYRFEVAFPRTLALAEQSDVRISGVNVGKVISLKAGSDGRTHVIIELDSRYAPLSSADHVILRQKTLLGETYVQILPGPSSAPKVADEGALPNSQVEKAVTLDDILSALTPRTRRAFQVWMQSLAAGEAGRGEAINSVFTEIPPFVEDANKLVTILASQEGAVRAAVHNTGVVFNALTEREGQFRELISNGEQAFSAAARASSAWANTWRFLPAFERNGTQALRATDSFAADASPLLEQLRPVERKLSSLLQATKPFAPHFNSFLTDLGPLSSAGKRGLPTIPRQLEETLPVLENVRPVLHNFDPLLAFAGQYMPELESFFANITAASEATASNKNDSSGPRQQHYLRTMQVIEPEGLSIYQQRIGTNRANAYPLPGAFSALANGLKVFSTSSCANSAPSVSGPANSTVSETIIKQLIEFKVANAPESSSNAVPAPACSQQGPFTFNGQTSQFPHVVGSEK